MMPKFLERKLLAEYPGNPSIAYATMNKLGYMHGSKETAAGRAVEAKHNRDMEVGKASGMPHPHKNLGKYLHKPKRGR